MAKTDIETELYLAMAKINMVYGMHMMNQFCDKTQRNIYLALAMIGYLTLFSGSKALMIGYFLCFVAYIAITQLGNYIEDYLFY